MAESQWTRHEFLEKSLKTGGALSITASSFSGQRSEAAETVMRATDGASEVAITLRINGKDHQLRIDPRTTLLDCIRETVALTGTKKGCDHGQCGACTVHVNGRRVNSCLSLAVMHDGEEITTIEGLGTPDALASHAGGIRCLRRIPVRLLHVRPDHVGRCVAQGTLRSRRRGGEGTDERQHLPLRRLCQYRGRDPTSSQKHLAASRSDPMHTFEFIRPADAAAAVATAAQAKTAQQGADVRFVAGGTTLLDLMKLNVETPRGSSTSTVCRSTRSKRRLTAG